MIDQENQEHKSSNRDLDILIYIMSLIYCKYQISRHAWNRCKYIEVSELLDLLAVEEAATL